MAQNESISTKQEQAIAQLLNGATQEECAKKVGVSRSTIQRWLDDGTFKQRLDTARHEHITAILQSLQAASVEAVQTLRDLMKSKTTPAPVRVSAAKAILDNLLRSREQLDIETRLRNLEMKGVTNYEPNNQWTN